jgi:phytoene dehydrogenase-like protein
VYEAAGVVGGAARSLELTLPGFVHDFGAAVCALVPASPFLRTLPLSEHGLSLVAPAAPFAHPLDGQPAIVVERSIEETCAQFTQPDARRYRELLEPWVNAAPQLMDALLAPFGVQHPIIMSLFGRHAIRSVEGLARGRFSSDAVQAMLAGVGAHSMVPLGNLATAGYALALLVSAHHGGWPVAKGGTQAFSNAMASYLRALGGEIVTNHAVESLAELPPARAVLCDVTPAQFARLAAKSTASGAASGGAARRLARHRQGPGVFKMDWALHQPVPWRDARCLRAGTLHLGGSLGEIAAAEREPWEGRSGEKPYVLAVQPSLFDASRAPTGAHTFWAYCHVPNGSTEDMTERIEAQIERYAPGFRDCVRARHALFPADLERADANLIGGDIAGGAADFAQLLWRSAALDPYATPIQHVYLCSSSTPPGVGVHGMCGFHAAQSALKHSFA